MEKENWQTKIKRVIKEKDGSFYLMIFVIFFTLLTLFLWATNLKIVFSKDKIDDNKGTINISDSKNDVDKALNDVITTLNNLDTATTSTSTATSSEPIIKTADLEKMKQALNEKIDQKNLASSSSSTIPVISQELDDSEQEIAELKLRIAELEEKLND
jgi:hypothetical protein